MRGCPHSYAQVQDLEFLCPPTRRPLSLCLSTHTLLCAATRHVTYDTPCHHVQLYLQQLAGTAGAAAQPPGVLRVLRSKACRGSLMFNTTLTQRQASELVCQLAATRLCFACAHGR